MGYDPSNQILHMLLLHESEYTQSKPSSHRFNEDSRMTLTRIYYQTMPVWVFAHPSQPSVESYTLPDRDAVVTLPMHDKHSGLYIFNASYRITSLVQRYIKPGNSSSNFILELYKSFRNACVINNVLPRLECHCE
jgi:hypothetical protein